MVECLMFVMSAIFKCDKHDFQTDDPEKWDSHMLGNAHTNRGHGLCNNCQNPVEVLFTGKMSATKTPALCENCAEQITGGQK